MDLEIDNIPLAEIISLSSLTENEVDCGTDFFSSLRSEDLKSEMQIVQIKTEQGGHNSGRTYYVKMSNDTEFSVDMLVSDIKRHAKAARKRAEARTFLQRAQLRVRRFYESLPVQAVSLLLIGMVSTRSSQHILNF